MQHRGRMLSGHSITQLTVQNDLECARACVHDYRCHSFNLVIQSDGTYHCELNDSDMDRYPYHVIQAAGTTYFGFADSLNRWAYI